MRRLLIAVLALWPICAAQAETLWVADARIIAVTTQCSSTTSVGDFYRAIFRPKGPSIGNGADSHLALFSQRASFWMRVPGNNFRPLVNYVGHTISSTLVFTSKGGGILDWQESVAFGAPAASNVTASLGNFFGTTGCTATLRMPFNLLP